jgi:uncharacterized protein (TIGR03435 family)
MRTLQTRIATAVMAVILAATPCFVTPVHAQDAATGAPRLRFEVASVKPPSGDFASMAESGRIGTKIAGDQVDIYFVTLAQLIYRAYSVKPNDLEGPAWINDSHFEIHAKLPAGATAAQVPQLLRTLLEERFLLKVHRETKPQNVYALVVPPSGHKLKPSIPDDCAAAESVTGDRIDPDGGRFAGGLRAQGPSGCSRLFLADGVMHMQYSAMSTEGLAQALTGNLHQRVIDATGLQGKYKVTLDISQQDLLTGTGVRPAADPNNPTPNEGPFTSVFRAVEKLGLRLENRHVAVELLVIDHSEKTPTDN